MDKKINKKRVVKCQYCDSEKIIHKPSQRSFVCCEHQQQIGKLTIINQDTLLQNQEVISKPALKNPIKEAGKEIPKEAPQENEGFEVEEEPEEVKKVEEEAPKSDFKCPQCNSPIEPYKDCMNPECKAEIIWGDK